MVINRCELIEQLYWMLLFILMILEYVLKSKAMRVSTWIVVRN